MARNFLQLGNGRGNCQLCGNKIKKGIPQISHRAYQSSASFHANAKDCFPRSKLYIKKNGCPHCFVVDKDGVRKSRWGDSYECTHCYKKVDNPIESEESFEAQGKPTWAGYCPFCQKWRSNEMSKKDGKLTICAKRVPSPHTNAGEWDWFNRENFARKGGKWTKPADNICGVILESKPTYLDSKNAEVLNMEEPMVEEPDFIPNGDGRAIGQQNSAINLTPLHAETFEATPKWECDACGKLHEDEDDAESCCIEDCDHQDSEMASWGHAGEGSDFQMTCNNCGAEGYGTLNSINWEHYDKTLKYEQTAESFNSEGMSHNDVWREVHRSPTSMGHRIFQCKHCSAMKTTKRNIPIVCEFCGEGQKEGFRAESGLVDINYDAKIRLNNPKDAKYITPSIEGGMDFENGEGVLSSRAKIDLNAESFNAESNGNWVMCDFCSEPKPLGQMKRMPYDPEQNKRVRYSGYHSTYAICNGCYRDRMKGKPVGKSIHAESFNAEHNHWHNKQNGQFYGKWSKHKKNGQFSTHNAETLEEIEGATAEATAGGLHSPSSFDITWEDLQGLSSPSMPPNEIHFSESKGGSSIKTVGIISVIGLFAWKGIEYINAKKSLKQSAEEKREGTMRKAQTQVKNSEYSVGQVNPVEAEGQEDVMGAEGVTNPRHTPSPTPSGYPSKSLKMW